MYAAAGAGAGGSPYHQLSQRRREVRSDEPPALVNMVSGGHMTIRESNDDDIGEAL